jgi:hypothetical protein
MKVIEPGHVYELATLDGEAPNRLVFVNREPGTEHPGTQTQEVLRTIIDALEALIDRTNHCDGCLPWPGNERIIKALTEGQRQSRLALLFHEQRAMERKLERGELAPETAPVAADGHFAMPKQAPPPRRRAMPTVSEKPCSICGERHKLGEFNVGSEVRVLVPIREIACGAIGKVDSWSQYGGPIYYRVEFPARDDREGVTGITRGPRENFAPCQLEALVR